MALAAVTLERHDALIWILALGLLTPVALRAETRAVVQLCRVAEVEMASPSSEWEPVTLTAGNTTETLWISTMDPLVVSEEDVDTVTVEDYEHPLWTLQESRIKQLSSEIAHRIRLRLKKARWGALATFTTTYRGQRLALLVDDHVLAAPRVIEPLARGELVVTGPWSQDEAARIVKAIKP